MSPTKEKDVHHNTCNIRVICMCLPVDKLRSSNNVDRVRQAHILFAFNMFLVLTGLLRGQATDTYGGGQATGQITCCPTELLAASVG